MVNPFLPPDIPTPDPLEYLYADEIINFNDREVLAVAEKLRDESDLATAGNCFHFVRDEIKHSSDHQLNPVTCTASEVLSHRTGYCYAKSHLLCALLRANLIPAGLCYQRLSLYDNGAPYSLHGLVALFLPEFGWYPIDPRGNRADVQAQFDPPNISLAFAGGLEGERVIPGIYVRPLQVIIDSLRSTSNWDTLLEGLPDSPPDDEPESLINFSLRDARDSDISALGVMNQQLIVDEGHRNPMTVEQLEDRMADWLADDYHATLLVGDGNLAGYALERVTAEHLYLRQFYIKPSFRRRGFGRAFISLLRQTRWNNHGRIRLDVLINNSQAIAFWHSVGFTDYCLTMESES